VRASAVIGAYNSSQNTALAKDQAMVACLEGSTGYEVLSWWQKLIWRFLIKLFSGRIGRWLLIKHCPDGKSLRRYATTHKALEMVYNYSWGANKDQKLFQRAVTHLLFNFMNGKAVRNRLALTERELKVAFWRSGSDSPNIISYAAGSARAVIRVLHDLVSIYPGARAMLIDKSRQALNYSRQLATEYGVEDRLVWVRGMLEELVHNAKEFPPDIVEMVGIMDYFDHQTAVEVCRAIFEKLPMGGTLITCNIVPNIEFKFLDNVLNWKMVYRQPDDLKNLLYESGFCDVRIYVEPLGIHAIAVCIKT